MMSERCDSLIVRLGRIRFPYSYWTKCLSAILFACSHHFLPSYSPARIILFNNIRWAKCIISSNVQDYISDFTSRTYISFFWLDIFWPWIFPVDTPHIFVSSTNRGEHAYPHRICGLCWGDAIVALIIHLLLVSSSTIVNDNTKRTERAIWHSP